MNERQKKMVTKVMGSACKHAVIAMDDTSGLANH